MVTKPAALGGDHARQRDPGRCGPTASGTVVVGHQPTLRRCAVSDYTAYVYLGELVEFGVTDEIFLPDLVALDCMLPGPAG